MKKTPRWQFTPQPGKSPKTAKEISPGPISWHIRTVDRGGPWGWGAVDLPTMWDDIVSKMANFETMTFDEIMRGESHPIPLSGLCAAARTRLQEINQDDVDELFSLRLAGQKRVWGIRDLNIFKVLWFDPDHTVCPSPKKHT